MGTFLQTEAVLVSKTRCNILLTRPAMEDTTLTGTRKKKKHNLLLKKCILQYSPPQSTLLQRLLLSFLPLHAHRPAHKLSGMSHWSCYTPCVTDSGYTVLNTTGATHVPLLQPSNPSQCVCKQAETSIGRLLCLSLLQHDPPSMSQANFSKASFPLTTSAKLSILTLETV